MGNKTDIKTVKEIADKIYKLTIELDKIFYKDKESIEYWGTRRFVGHDLDSITMLLLETSDKSVEELGDKNFFYAGYTTKKLLEKMKKKEESTEWTKI